MAARRNKRMVTQAEFEDAKDKVMMGAERKSLVMTEEEKMLTAYHEGGHAILALNVKATDPVHKATIIPRGRALGMVMQLPERDKLSMSYEQMTSRLAIMMGGRVAEEMIFGTTRSPPVRSPTSSRRPARPHDGDALGLLEGARRRRLRREPGRGVPRHVGRAHAERLGGDRAEDRRRRSAGWSRKATPRRAAFSKRSATISKRSPRACSNSRRSPATRSRTCSTASARCASP